MFYLFYNLVSLLLLVPVLLFTICRSLKLGWPLSLAGRFGFIPSSELSKLQGRPVLLLHAVSVGEIIAARPLLKALRDRYPDHALVVSNSTETGRQTASGFKEIDLCVYFPFDFLPSVRTMLRLLNPCIVIIMETEIWPNFTREAAQQRIPLVMANGRISDRSFPRYLKLSWLFRPALQNFTLFCMQSETVRERIVAIGAPAERVVVCGNLKFDIPYYPVAADEKGSLRRRYAIPEESLVIVAGSTHAGEEEMLVDVYRTLLSDSPGLFMVMVPRHPQRCAEIADFMARNGIRFRRFTELMTDRGEKFCSGELLLVDVVGELMNFYALADVALVGGSLVPVGGHNLLEPASRGIPVVFGTYMANFREITALVLENRAGIQVYTQETLAETLRRLINDPAERETLGSNGLAMLRESGGSAKRHLEIIAAQLASR